MLDMPENNRLIFFCIRFDRLVSFYSFRIVKYFPVDVFPDSFIDFNCRFQCVDRQSLLSCPSGESGDVLWKTGAAEAEISVMARDFMVRIPDAAIGKKHFF